MDGSAEDEGKRRGPGRVAALALMVALLALVAVAAGGELPLGAGDGPRRPADRLLDTIVSLVLVVLVLGVVVIGWLFTMRRDLVREAAERRRRRHPFVTLAGGAVVFLVLALFVWIASERVENGLQLPQLPQPPASGEGGEGADPEAYTPRFAWEPVAATLVLAGAAAGALWIGRTRRRRSLPKELPSLAEALADVLAESLDDLRAEPDARRAIVAAYARLERTLAAHGVPRRPSEAPKEYLGRVLQELSVSARAARRLTLLFEVARFSTHELDAAAKAEAIASLEAVQDELRAAELLAQVEAQAGAGP